MIHYRKINWMLVNCSLLAVCGVIFFFQKDAVLSSDEVNTAVQQSDSDRRSSVRSNKASDRRLSRNRQQEYLSIFKDLLKKYPGLEPEWKSVPDEKNGFLQWLNFCEVLAYQQGVKMKDVSIPLPENVEQVLNQQVAWDADVIAQYFEDNQEMLDEVVRIGLLDEQSSYTIHRDPFMTEHVNIANRYSHILCAGARVAAESGNIDLD